MRSLTGIRRGTPDISLSAAVDGSALVYKVVGYPALPGYDLASGLGTLDASKFVPALAHAADDSQF